VQIPVRSAWVIGTLAMLFNVSAHGTGPGLDDLIASVLRNGRDGQLPPHLSLVLGLGSGDAPLEVKQAVLREGSEVRVFNVSVADHKNIVILRTNEQKHSTKAYLVTTNGKLRKAVSYEAGGEPHMTQKAAAGGAAADEIKFWTTLNQPRAPGP
jgi:hypothetical protein